MTQSPTITHAAGETAQASRHLARPVKSGELAPVLVLFALFVAITAFICPFGNFPLNDDWMYSFAVKTFIDTGRIEFVGPNCTNCVLHIVIGAAVCKLFGYSHEVLRFVTISFGFLSTLAVYLLGREFRVSKKLSFFAAVAFATNPLFLNLTFSYMTDILSIALCTFSTLFTVRGIKQNSAKWFTLAGIILISAVAVRQTNVALAGANALLLLYMWAKRRHSWSVLLGMVILPVVAFKAVEKLAPVSTNHPMAYSWYQNHVNGIFTSLITSPPQGFFNLTVHFGETAFYLTFTLLAVVSLFVPSAVKQFIINFKNWSVSITLAAGVAIATCIKFIGQAKSLMPFSQNLLRFPMLGTLAIMGINFPNLPDQWRLPLTYACAIGATIMLATCFDGVRKSLFLLGRNMFKRNNVEAENRGVAEVYCWLTAAALLTMCVVQSAINDLDRYYVIPSAAAITCLLICSRWLRLKPIWFLAVPLLVLTSVYGLAAEQDYMSWNRARWEGAQKLEAQGVSPLKIDGGAEYNFVHNHLLYNTRFKGAEPYRHWRWWTITGEEYVITFSEIPGYTPIAKQRYWSAMTPFHSRCLFVQKRGSLK